MLNSTARILQGVRMVFLHQFSARLWAVALSHCCSCRIRMVPTLYLNGKYGGLTVKQGHFRNISSAVCIPHYHSPLNCITYSIKHFTTFLKKQNLSCLQHCFSLSSTSSMQHDAGSDGYRSGGALVSAVRKGLGHMNIFCKEYCPGQYNQIVCPQCQGGQSREKSLSLIIGKDGVSAKWICFRAKCGWTGGFKIAGMSVGSSARELENLAFQNAISFDEAADVISDVEVTALKGFTEENLRLEQISDQDLCDYFASRKISRETLQRNGVMQTRRNNKIVIAFTYRKDGKIVNCKYRDAQKHFWQEKHGQKIPYGLDDIKEARDIIIVEGEFDKLSMEEAGYRNCISVPNGAPPKVSTKELPPVEQDKRYEFLWNAKEYYQQASRIYLATDADNAGHALAEELARRIGRERCWQVTWPRKSETTKELCKDANEVLIRFGRQALKEAIKGAELYPIQGLFRCQRLYDVTDAYYNCQLGTELGRSTGWAGLDELYQISEASTTYSRSTIIVPVGNTRKDGWAASRNILGELNEASQQASGPSEHLGGLSNEVSAGFLSGGIGEASFEADKTGDRAMGLTPAEDTGEAVVSKMIRADKRHFFFDLGCNNRGQFLRISEVIGSDRSAIIVPVSALEQFHDVLGHFVDITRTQGLAAASGANVCTVAAAHRRNEN